MESGIGIAWLVVLGLFFTVGTLTVIGLRANRDSDYLGPGVGTGLVASAVLLLVVLILGFMSFMPQYRLWRASIEKRILVEEARAQADSAIELARAEVERAKGTAEANRIVSGSITEPYLRYLYINNLAETQNQVIYLPTEAGLPILEAERLAPK